MKTDDSIVIQWFNSTSFSANSFFLNLPREICVFLVLCLLSMQQNITSGNYIVVPLCQLIDTYFEQLYCCNHKGRQQTN